MSGCLYILGVGPGDPELLTLKALRLLQSSAVVAYPANQRGESQARQIVAQWLQPQQQELAICLPFTRERSASVSAYDRAAEQIAAKLEQGLTVALLCEGDPLLYGSAMYILERLRSYPIHMVPGISSVLAAAAVCQQPLVRLEQDLQLLPASVGLEALIEALRSHHNLAILKPAGAWRATVLQALRRSGRVADACYIEAVSRTEQRIERDVSQLDAQQPGPYFALFLVTSSA